MSEWHDAGTEDIEIDGEEINIYVKSNYGGSVYVVVPIELMKKILEKYKD